MTIVFEHSQKTVSVFMLGMVVSFPFGIKVVIQVGPVLLPVR
jgi:hypothetical protein